MSWAATLTYRTLRMSRQWGGENKICQALCHLQRLELEAACGLDNYAHSKASRESTFCVWSRGWGPVQEGPEGRACIGGTWGQGLCRRDLRVGPVGGTCCLLEDRDQMCYGVTYALCGTQAHTGADWPAGAMLKESSQDNGARFCSTRMAWSPYCLSRHRDTEGEDLPGILPETSLPRAQNTSCSPHSQWALGEEGQVVPITKVLDTEGPRSLINQELSTPTNWQFNKP